MGKINTDDLVTIEYNIEQSSFNIGNLSYAIETNIECMQNGVPSDFVLVGVYTSYDAAEKAAEKMETNRDEYLNEHWDDIRANENEIY